MASLLAGRNAAPLNDAQILRASNTFNGLDPQVNARYEAGTASRFRVVQDAGEEYGEIVFSDDLYPGGNVANANASLSMVAAVAHELSHYYRWRDIRELHGDHLRHLDEALTSLDAAQRYARHLSDIEIQELIADAYERLRLHTAGLGEA